MESNFFVLKKSTVQSVDLVKTSWQGLQVVFRTKAIEFAENANLSAIVARFGLSGERLG